MSLSIGEHIDDKEQEELIKEYVTYLKPKSVLEVGCGKGRLAKYFEGVEYVGIDKKEEYLPKESLPGQEFKIMKGSDLKFPDKLFDMSFTCTVLMHNENGEDLIKEMIRVTNRFVLFIEAKRGFLYVRRHDYERICNDAGFELWDFRTLRTSDRFRLALWFYRRKRTRLPKMEIKEEE